MISYTDPQIRNYQLLGLSKQFLKALLMYNSAMLWGGIYLDAAWNDQHAVFSHANANVTHNPLILSFILQCFSLCVFDGGSDLDASNCWGWICIIISVSVGREPRPAV